MAANELYFKFSSNCYKIGRKQKQREYLEMDNGDMAINFRFVSRGSLRCRVRKLSSRFREYEFESLWKLFLYGIFTLPILWAERLSTEKVVIKINNSLKKKGINFENTAIKISDELR